MPLSRHLRVAGTTVRARAYSVIRPPRSRPHRHSASNGSLVHGPDVGPLPASPVRTFANVLALLLVCCATGLRAQQSDDPSDVTTGLTFTTNAGGEVAICTAGSTTTGGTLSGTTTTAAALVPTPPCGTFTPGTTGDAWFRLDVPAAGSHRFRFTVLGGATNPVSNGGMAAYLAPTAAGPFQLVDCAIGGNPTSGQFSNPSLEVTCVPAGSKIYIRVWDEASPSTRNFSICVQGQIWNGTQQPIADTPCDVATSLSLVAPLATQYNTFACTEAFPLDPSCGGYRGGDVWYKVDVPATGTVTLHAAYGTIAARRVLRMGFALYTSSSCSNLSLFNEVACNQVTLGSLEVQVATVRCLPSPSVLWIRAYSTTDAQSTPSRFGAFRIRVSAGTGGTGAAPNENPCTATPITVGSTCPAYNSGVLGTNNGACNTAGAPAPGCGVISNTTADVWYSFVAPADGTVAIRVNGNNSVVPAFDPAVALYTGPCTGPLTLVDCDAKHGTGINAYLYRTGLVPGDTYYIRVWGEGTSGTQQDIFYLCVTNPQPPPGSCMYVLRMTNQNAAGSQTMRVAVGSDTTDYVTSGEASELFFIPVPIGASVTFIYYNTGVTAPSTYALFPPGTMIPTWLQTVGGAVIGPSPPPSSRITISPACSPSPPLQADCLGATTICGPTMVMGTTAGHTGSIVDLTAENRGCLGPEHSGGNWYVFRAVADGRVSFSVVASIPTDDFDFAVWDAGDANYTPTPPFVDVNICSPVGPPIRCSNARVAGSTGLHPGMANRYSEGLAGYSWVSPLDVEADHVYILYVGNIQNAGNRAFQIQWTQLVDDTGTPDNTILDCETIILPVELLHLNAEPGDAHVDVTWATASELNSDHFVVERSVDGFTFAPIGKVEAAGFSQGLIDYGFRDDGPVNGANYYRLRQVDKDGSTTVSHVVVAIFGERIATPRIFPNPASDRMYVVMDVDTENGLMMNVSDATGRTVRSVMVQQPGGGLSAEFDISDLAPGPYMLHLWDANGQAFGHARFVKR